MANISELQHENQRLQQQLATLENQLNDVQARVDLLQNTLDALPSTIYTTDKNGKILVVNKAFAEWAAKPRSDIENHDLGELFPAELVEYWMQCMQYVAETGQITSNDEEIHSQHGTLTFRSQRFPLRNSSGEIVAVTGLTTNITEQLQTQRALADSERLLHIIINNAPMVIYVKDINNRMMIVNELYGRVINRKVTDIVGKTEQELFPPELVDAWRESEQQIYDSHHPLQVDNVFMINGEPHDFLTVQFPIYTDTDEPYAICGISTDVTSIRSAERERAIMQETVIEAQKSALRELSTPLIPIAEDIVVVPLIGSIDGQRADQVMETLLEGASRYQASNVIIDITGLPIVDTYVAKILLSAAKALKLLGSDIILTGISPTVAQTLIGIGVDLGTISTPGTLQNGIAYAMRKTQKGNAQE